MRTALSRLLPPYTVIKAGVTEEEYYRWADEDTDAEYLDGRIVLHSPASLRHEQLFAFLLTLLNDFTGIRRAGVVLGSRIAMRLDRRWSPEPDLVYLKPRSTRRLKKKRLEGPADWVVEILSPSTLHTDLKEKLPKYKAERIPEIWYVDPDKRALTIEILKRGSYVSRTYRNGRVESKALPGFWIRAEWLWRDPLPSTIGCLKKILPEAFRA